MNIFHVFINQATKLFYLQFKKEKLFLIIIILIFNIRKNYFEWYIYLIIFIFTKKLYKNRKIEIINSNFILSWE